MDQARARGTMLNVGRTQIQTSVFKMQTFKVEDFIRYTASGLHKWGSTPLKNGLPIEHKLICFSLWIRVELKDVSGSSALPCLALDWGCGRRGTGEDGLGKREINISVSSQRLRLPRPGKRGER